jgi:hypothetical protein
VFADHRQLPIWGIIYVDLVATRRGIARHEFSNTSPCNPENIVTSPRVPGKRSAREPAFIPTPNVSVRDLPSMFDYFRSPVIEARLP